MPSRWATPHSCGAPKVRCWLEQTGAISNVRPSMASSVLSISSSASTPSCHPKPSTTSGIRGCMSRPCRPTSCRRIAAITSARRCSARISARRACTTNRPLTPSSLRMSASQMGLETTSWSSSWYVSWSPMTRRMSIIASSDGQPEEPARVASQDHVAVDVRYRQLDDVLGTAVKAPYRVTAGTWHAPADVKEEGRIGSKQDFGRPDGVKTDLDRLARHETGVDVHVGKLLGHQDTGDRPPNIEMVEDQGHVVELCGELCIQFRRAITNLRMRDDGQTVAAREREHWRERVAVHSVRIEPG